MGGGVERQGNGGSDEAREVGRKAARAWRRRLADKVIDDLRQRDPEVLKGLAELGILRREYIEDPDDGPMTRAEPMEVVERFLERSIERRPSLLARLGLSAVQILNTSDDDQDVVGVGASEHLAVVFTDLEGFTTFTATKGDEAASLLLADHHRTIGPVVRSRGGKVVKRIGDGLLLTFPEPEAAVLACLELVEVAPKPLRLRAGVHVGDVVVTRDDVIGHVVNVAARVAETAEGGEVIATTAVRTAVAKSLPRLEFGRARKPALKGIPEPVSVYPVSYASAS